MYSSCLNTFCFLFAKHIQDCTILDWSSREDRNRFVAADAYLNKPYNGPSIVVIPLPAMQTLPGPVPLGNIASNVFASTNQLATSDLFAQDIGEMITRLTDKIGQKNINAFKVSISCMFENLNMNRNNSAAKDASSATVENEATAIRLMYGGTYKYKLDEAPAYQEISGSGHHGPDYVGVASLRAGKGYRVSSAPVGARIL